MKRTSSSKLPKRDQLTERPPFHLTIGIARETYAKWERRAPLCPSHVKSLKATWPGLDVIVQPSSKRIFSDHEYRQAGALITDDLSTADIILGVKQVQKENLLNDKTYMFFAHVIKGQRENMDLLQTILEKNIRLVDYECITSNPALLTSSMKSSPSGEQSAREESKGDSKQKRSSRPKRLVAFGRYAGIAGMLDMLQGLGQRLLAAGYSTPFLEAPLAYMNHDLEAAKKRVVSLGDRIANVGLPDALEPLVFAFTGHGNVAKGALEIFRLLPMEMITKEELHKMRKDPAMLGAKKVYGIIVQPEDRAARTGAKNGEFSYDHFHQNPDHYESIFAREIAPYCNVIVNGIYWDDRYPRLLTKDEIRELYEKGQKRLIAVADISCDINGSIEFLEKATTVENPFFQYDPISGNVSNDIDGSGITVMGVDILPTELPRESSEHFGNALAPLLAQLVRERNAMHPRTLPIELDHACIASDGKLNPRYKYIESLMRKAVENEPPHPKMPSVSIALEGHLFDSGFINQALDILEHHECDFYIMQCKVCQLEKDRKSTVLIRVESSVEEALESIPRKFEDLADSIHESGATVHCYDRKGASPVDETVLVLGAGRVASSLAEYLGRNPRRKIVVASALKDEAQEVASRAKRGEPVVLDVVNDKEGLAKLVEEADVVVSLLPAPLHPLVAEECIKAKTNMVTASYASDEIKKLDKRCQEAGIIILNEMGLDPGMDHMSAMKIIDHVKSRGGRITSFSSVCGGLPAPEAANNPLKYKFSWSPMGVLRASCNPATYRKDHEHISVDGEDLLDSAMPFDVWPDMNHECLPNRDSLVYGDLYGIENAGTIFRGTLRFEGFSSLLHTLKKLGLFSDTKAEKVMWNEELQRIVADHGHSNLRECIKEKVSFHEDEEKVEKEAERVESFLEWLGLTSAAAVTAVTTKEEETSKNQQELCHPESILKSFCFVLEDRLKFEDHERDMVLMHHDIRVEYDDVDNNEADDNDKEEQQQQEQKRHGVKSEIFHSSLKMFGDSDASAMCKTVGYTAAAGTDLVLSGGVKRTGIVLPIYKEIYNPVLDLLEKEGIVFEETIHSVEEVATAEPAVEKES